MQSLVYNYSWTKQQLWNATRCYIRQAAMVWNVPAPVFHDHTLSDHRIRGGGRYYGYQHGRQLYVNVRAATTPPQVRNRIWSYPGHKTDRTCAGILAHEFGHYLDQCLDHPSRSSEWRTLLGARHRITSYEPVPAEALAETLRVFALNPDLLRNGRRERYDFVRRLGLVPLHSTPWETVLLNAPPFIFTAAQKFASS